MNGKQKLESLQEANAELQMRLAKLEIARGAAEDKSEERERVFTHLQNVRLADAKLKFWARIVGGIFLCLLLLAQNIFVAVMIAAAYKAARLQELSLIFSIIIPATLAESAAIVHTAVKWIFKETDCTRHS